MSDSTYNLDHLTELEAESIYVLREVAAQFEAEGITMALDPSLAKCLYNLGNLKS